MFLRFVTDRPDPFTPDDGRPGGVFLVAYALLRGDEELPVLDDWHRGELRRLIDWFEAEVPIPHRFRRRGREDRGLSWFRSDADAAIRRVREVCRIVEAAGVPTRTLLADRPGYVLYEDAVQVVAEPFAETPR